LDPQLAKDLIKVIAQFIISLILLFFGLHILLSEGYEPYLQKLAVGWIGGVIGYWLK